MTQDDTNPMQENEIQPAPENVDKPKRSPRFRKGEKLTLKQREFARITAETLNPTEAARQVVNTSKPNGIYPSVYASNTLANPKVRNEIERIMRENKVDEALITQNVHKALTKVPKKPITWGEKHQFVKFAAEMLGYSQDKANISVNVGMVIKE